MAIVCCAWLLVSLFTRPNINRYYCNENFTFVFDRFKKNSFTVWMRCICLFISTQARRFSCSFHSLTLSSSPLLDLRGIKNLKSGQRPHCKNSWTGFYFFAKKKTPKVDKRNELNFKSKEQTKITTKMMWKTMAWSIFTYICSWIFRKF